MVFFENIRTATHALRANTMRSILTTLGIVIGTAAVIAVVSIVQGLEHMITKELQGVGATYMIVQAKQPDFQDRFTAHEAKLTWEDGEAIKDHVPTVKLITPVMFASQVLKYRDETHSVLTLGVTDAWPDVSNHEVDRGRFFAHIDLQNRRKVIVVGEKVIKELGLGRDPVGKEIYVGHLPVTVIGVMEKRGQSLGQDTDDLAFIPFDTALSLFGRRAGEHVQLRLQARSPEVVDRTKEGIKRILRTRHRIAEGEPDDFEVMVQDELLDTVGSILGSVTAVVGAIVGVALLVGGIGIMNILLVSVTERTREIGLRKAIGARRQDILLQFLIEAIVLALLGGVIGVAAGFGIGMLASAVLPEGWPPAYVPLWAVLLAFGFCGMVGVFFGIYPAAKAARLDPIDALRYE
jgi:putative ABC transport system permease protein